MKQNQGEGGDGRFSNGNSQFWAEISVKKEESNASVDAKIEDQSSRKIGSFRNDDGNVNATNH